MDLKIQEIVRSPNRWKASWIIYAHQYVVPRSCSQIMRDDFTAVRKYSTAKERQI